MFPGMADSPVVFNASKGGDLAGAIAPHLGKPGSPASWAFNFSVDDLESAVARAGQLGGEVPMVGIMDMPDEAAEQETPDHWIVYFHVDDVDATVELAAARGGTAIMAPNQFADIGRIAVVADPQGAVLGLITPGDGPQP